MVILSLLTLAASLFAAAAAYKACRLLRKNPPDLPPDLPKDAGQSRRRILTEWFYGGDEA